MPKKKITFKELAKISGVSIGTLSRYFNNGAISQKKKQIIKKHIEHFGFVKNAAAAAIRSSKQGTIIIRTLISSDTQDRIIEGLISNIDDDVIVKYSQKDETSIIKTISWAIKQRPKNLVIFAPYNATRKFEVKLQEVKEYSQTVVYDYKNSIVSNVSPSFKQALRELSQKYEEIYYIYEDINDTTTFQERVQLLQQIFKKVVIRDKNFALNTNDLYIFQTKKFRVEMLAQYMDSNKLIKNVSIDYNKPLLFKDDDEWIFLDHFFIGYKLAQLLCDNEVHNEKVDAKLM